MAELEIRTTGEVLLADQTVGQITFTKAFIEADVAGCWWPEGYGEDESGDPRDDCEGCADKDDDISKLEDEVEALKTALKPHQEFQGLRNAHGNWSQATFGAVSAVGPAKHLAKEALEVAAEPTNVTEHADCWMLLWDMQRRAGISDKQLYEAIEAKLKVNMARSWPAPAEGEAQEHIREAEVAK